jgi:hypothetical protein
MSKILEEFKEIKRMGFQNLVLTKVIRMFSISRPLQSYRGTGAISLNIDTITVLLTDQYTRPGPRSRALVKRFAGGLSGI